MLIGEEVQPDETDSGFHYRDTFRLAGAGLARISADGRFLDVNQYLCDLLGYPREVLMAKRFQDITHPDDLQTNIDVIGEAKSGQIDAYRLQKRYIRANGEILWADLNASVLRDENGEVTGMIAIVTDIGAFKRHEERMDFLLGELSHRSKNLFTIMLNLIGQTNADSVEEYRRKLEARILALVASQDQMLSEGGQTVSFQALALRQLSAFLTSNDSRVTLKGADQPLGANATRILGMALHELATNSCKYGALSVPDGRLTIETEQDDTAGTVTLRWTERGGPPVVPPTTSGFGRRVIERMIHRSFDAEVDLDFAPEGVTWQCRMNGNNLRR